MRIWENWPTSTLRQYSNNYAMVHTYNSDSFHSNIIYYLLLHTTKPHISLLSTQNHKISLTAHPSTPALPAPPNVAPFHLRGVHTYEGTYIYMIHYYLLYHTVLYFFITDNSYYYTVCCVHMLMYDGNGSENFAFFKK